MRRWIVMGCLLFVHAAFAALPESKPADVGMDAAKLGEIDSAVGEAIEGGQDPRRGRGRRSLGESRLP